MIIPSVETCKGLGERKQAQKVVWGLQIADDINDINDNIIIISG